MATTYVEEHSIGPFSPEDVPQVDPDPMEDARAPLDPLERGSLDLRVVSGA
jgi:hypothetical protein